MNPRTYSKSRYILINKHYWTYMDIPMTVPIVFKDRYFGGGVNVIASLQNHGSVRLLQIYIP